MQRNDTHIEFRKRIWPEFYREQMSFRKTKNQNKKDKIRIVRSVTVCLLGMCA